MPANAAAPKAMTTAETPFCAAPATPGSNSRGGRFSPISSCSATPPLVCSTDETTSGAASEGGTGGSSAAPSPSLPSSGFFGGVVVHKPRILIVRHGTARAQSLSLIHI